MRRFITVALIVVAAAVIAVLAVFTLSPAPGPDRRPALADVAPLAPVARASTIVTPAAITIAALQEAIEAMAPRTLAGKRDGLNNKALTGAAVEWTLNRGAVAVAGRPEGLVVATPLTGTFHVTGLISKDIGDIGSVIGGLIGGDIGQQFQGLAGKAFDQRADVRGNILMQARPALTPAWRIEPNLIGQVSISDVALPIAGVRLNVSGEVKPYIDRAVADQVAALAARIRSDPFLELSARREWAKLCRSLPLGTGAAGASDLWLEVRPTRAFAAQPSADAAALNLVIGVGAETRIAAAETKPDCPFPAQLDIVPQAEAGKIDIAVPIDLPYADVNRLLEAQLTGRTFPEDRSGDIEFVIRSAALAASGDRLLMSLRVKVREKSLFGLGVEAMVYVWGRPLLDADQQQLRFTDLALDVDSEAAFGLLGAAARAAIPYLRGALADKAVVDLKPFAANARSRIEAAVADFRKSEAGVRTDVTITDLKLTGIAFDARTLRVIAQANGALKVEVTSLVDAMR